MSGTTLHFKDGTSCAPGTRNDHDNEGITFVDLSSENYLTSQTAPTVFFVTLDQNGSMTIVSGGGKSNVKVGDPRHNRGITIGNNTVQHNTFD
ncbi:MAG TPA: hypothetical protein VM581_04870 [Magnetospirillaceae bacterium]|nr:hypothetical protein [Magnetospirillaceae bacterium]